MRVPEIKTYLTLWETLGTRPSRLAWGEIYLGLKTGVVEAAEGPISSAYAAKFHEAAPNVIRTDHLMSSAHITINEKTFPRLPPDMQKIWSTTAREATQCGAQAGRGGDRGRGAQDGRRGREGRPGRQAADRRQGAKDGVAKMEKDGAWTHGPLGKDPEARHLTRAGPGAAGPWPGAEAARRPLLLDRMDGFLAGYWRLLAHRRGRARARHALIATWSSPSACRCSRATLLGRPIAWVEEIATYAFIWMTFVGASLGLKEGRHILIATFVGRLAAAPAAACCARSSGCWCC